MKNYISNKKIFILIPAYNEEKIIKSVINDIKKIGYNNIIVIDDGSTDLTYNHINQDNIITLRHLINRGKGAAVKTGIEAAKILGADILITMDGDGQHNPEDINKMVRLLNNNDIVLGTRMKNTKNMPFYKVISNKIGNYLTWIAYGILVSDSQSGFRAYTKKALDLIDTQSDKYEYDSEVLREIKRNNLKYIEIPVEVRYTKYSMNKQNKQNLKNGIKTAIKMFMSNQ